MADHDDAPEKIKCLECGKEFSFLAPHLSKAHQMGFYAGTAENSGMRFFSDLSEPQ